MLEGTLNNAGEEVCLNNLFLLVGFKLFEVEDIREITDILGALIFSS